MTDSEEKDGERQEAQIQKETQQKKKGGGAAEKNRPRDWFFSFTASGDDARHSSWAICIPAEW